jgi:hypothetical protein
MLNVVQPYQQRIASHIQNSFKDYLIEMERARQDEIIQAREYYDGVHNVELNNRTRQFLNVRGDNMFTVNYCPMVVNAKADRLKLDGFDVEDDAEQASTLWRWWRRNRMDRKQNIIHRAAVRDGDTFVLVEWDAYKDMPRFSFEPAFAGDGVMVYYSEEYREQVEFASKHWRIKRGANAGKQRRLNLYFPDRIEKYVSTDGVALGMWMPYNPDNAPADDVREGKLGMAGVYWHTDNRREGGNPLGVPIVHFKHNDVGESYGTSHLASVIPVQDLINKAMVDLIANADSNGFGLLVGYGTLDWTDTRVGPGAIAAVTKGPSDAKLEKLAADNPQGLLAVYNALVMEVARISGTPLSYFQVSGHTPAEGTMKQQESALVTQVKKSQTDFGNGWERCMDMARRLHNAYSDNPPIDTEPLIESVWESAETRNDKEHAETLAIKVNTLGVSKDQAQIELGYDARERASFARAQLREAAMQLRVNAVNAPATPIPTNNDEQEIDPDESDGTQDDSGSNREAGRRAA